jgi:predicted outer membrane repeat protein
MIRRFTRIASPAVAVIGVLGAAAMNAQQAQAAPAGTKVPCDSAALASAIGNASSGDTLSLAHSCLYTLTSSLPIIENDLTIDGNDATLERSYAPGTPAFTMMQINFGSIIINDLNFRNGVPAIYFTAAGNALTVNGGKFSDNNGLGAIDADDTGGGPVVNGAIFTGNSSSGPGGAISDFADSGALRITDTAFRDNHAIGGGAIWEAGQGNIGLSHDVFSGNSAQQQGGAIIVGAAGDIEDTKFYDNRASQGGGLWLSSSEQFPTTLTGDDIYDNYASDGAGIYAANGTAVLVSDTIVKNHATDDGGGIYANTSSIEFSVSLTGSQIAGNYAGSDGGGIYNDASDMDATQSQIENNAASAGGGIYEANINDFAGFTLTTTSVRNNRPDNCEPAGSVTGCVG